MRILSKSKDGGPTSPVDGYFLIELKHLLSIAILKFNKGGRECYHTHAFNAFTWFLFGELKEIDIDGTEYRYTRSLLPKITLRKKNHKVFAYRDSWCLTLRGPWSKTWTEDRSEGQVTLGWGRSIVR